MFDRILLAPTTRTESVTRNVHEHKAPTDDSIRLYGEMLEKARAEVASVILEQVPNNVLNHAKLTMTDSFETGQQRIKIAFKLNGEEHVVEVTEHRDAREIMSRAIVEKLLRHVGEALWKELPRR